jgi:predicted hotdog family 3-hydroxylacyl-ACP dehydratase
LLIFPSVETLLPHRNPAIVVDRIVAFTPGKISCERVVRSGEHYGPGLSREGIVEFCAQSAILSEAIGTGAAVRQGVLASIDDFTFSLTPAPGVALVADIETKTKFGNLALFECTVTTSGKQVAHGFIKAAQS